ncbi:hypothetical protein FSP39_004533 [Pinctada imbricata]|uniref:G-protein coupled receptors family 1 profile domain-containing protein n=1 Tax=Pinctada imbricata TaxID=66713 RepID=A0AA88Y3D9_PINIB|nr:hypothetical protein FSP39_004533 [Pinctada imbricata]
MDRTDSTDTSAAFYAYYYGVFGLITLVNVIGNTLVIVVIVRHECLRRSCNAYLVNQAFADLFLAVTYPLYNLVYLDVVGSLFDDYWTCTIFISQVVVAIVASPWSLVAITANRYIAIIYPLSYVRYVTARSTALSIAVLWIGAETYTLVAHVAFSPKREASICTYEVMYTSRHAITLNIISGALPLIILICLYIRIIKVARRQARAIAAQRPVDNRTQTYKSDKRSTTVVTLLLGFYITTWLPVSIYFLYYFSCGECQISLYFRATTRIMVYVNSAINFFVYAVRLQTFRNCLMMEIKQLKNICMSPFRRQ